MALQYNSFYNNTTDVTNGTAPADQLGSIEDINPNFVTDSDDYTVQEIAIKVGGLPDIESNFQVMGGVHFATPYYYVLRQTL